MEKERQMLELVAHTNPQKMAIDRTGRHVIASILALDDDAFNRLMRDVWCGTPGFSGYNDQWGVRLYCPSYTLN